MSRTQIYNSISFTGKLVDVSAHTDQSITVSKGTWEAAGNGYYKGTLYQSRESWIDVFIPDFYFAEHKDELLTPGAWFQVYGNIGVEICRGTGIVHRFIKVSDIHVAEIFDVK